MHVAYFVASSACEVTMHRRFAELTVRTFIKVRGSSEPLYITALHKYTCEITGHMLSKVVRTFDYALDYQGTETNLARRLAMAILYDDPSAIAAVAGVIWTGVES